MKQSDISDRIIVQGSEDPSFTGNFEITLSATAEGIALPARLIQKDKGQNGPKGHQYGRT
jgi:hypothetical protein